MSPDLTLTPEDFEQALAHDDLSIALQPLVNLRSGQVVRLEALARWQHPDRGQIAPATFVPLAERCGAATALAFQVLRECSVFLPMWRELLPDLRVAVNISMQTMQDPTFPDRLAAFLKRNGAAAEWLPREITEKPFMGEPGRPPDAHASAGAPRVPRPRPSLRAR